MQQLIRFLTRRTDLGFFVKGEIVKKKTWCLPIFLCVEMNMEIEMNKENIMLEMF